MIAAGIDLGGTKIEAQVFDDNWDCAEKQRSATPQTYADLLSVVSAQVSWIEKNHPGLPIGIGAAGLIAPSTGLALTANLPASGKPFPKDLARASGRAITYLNDCRAFALSEAIFGAGRPFRTMVGIVFGTGNGGGVVVDGQLLSPSLGDGGEFGHLYAPAHLVKTYDLPIVQCGCGRMGCIETFVSGRGMSRLAQTLTGRAVQPTDIASARHHDPQMKKVWHVWCKLVAEQFLAFDYILNPDVIVLGGGLSNISGLCDELGAAMQNAQFKDFPIPEILLAQGGDVSGVRGAAYAAWQEAQNG